MEIFKRNIWKLYYSILVLSILFFLIISYALWSQNLNTYKERQETLNKATSYYIENLFSQYETILDIAIKNIFYKKSTLKRDKRVLDQILQLNPSLAGFGIFNTNGEAILTSSNLDISKAPRLMDNPLTKDDFIAALQTNRMVIGKTYYVKAIDALVIPIRKRITNANGDVVAVLGSGILLTKQSNFIRSLLGHGEICLFRDKDHFIQFYNFDKKIYTKPMPKEHVAQIEQEIQKKFGKNIETIKANQELITMPYKAYVTNKYSLNSCKYIKRYGLWVIVSTPFETIQNDYLQQELVILLIYIVIMITIYYLVKMIDKSEIQKEKTLKNQAIRDSLTSLHNRFYIEEKVKHYKEEYTLFFIDLDGFKTINDSFGHEYGDKVLQIIAKRLLQFEKEGRDIIRYSGDEFIFITEFMSDDEIKEFSRELLHEISKEFVINEFRFIVGASIGVARYPDDGKSFDEVKRYADLAMYKAKEIKNSYVIFHKKLMDEYQKTATIEQELKTAIEKKELSMVYQPQVLIDGEIYGVEALVRWDNSKLGNVSPAEFISIAEATGLIKEIGRFIIDQVLIDMDEMQNGCKKRFHVSINISAKQFAQHDFLSCIVGKLSQSLIATKYITIEITESVFIDDQKHVQELLDSMKKQGVTISLDDFGTGYSSMSILQKLPLDELKIDKSFIDDIVKSKNSQSIVHSIIIIAKSLGLKVVAEGVEDFEQKEILDEMGCDIYQGYLFSKPLTKEQLLATLKANGGVFKP